MNFKVLLIIINVILFGCAATYTPPTISNPNIIKNISGSKSDLFRVANQTLIMEGYQIVSSNEKLGTISTAPKRMALDETYCDCGTTMGLPYIKDKRTVTTVSIGLIVDNSKINVKATINGEYLKGDVVQGVDMICVSTGKIENSLLQKMKSQL